ncbi:MAG: hypothetical protein K9J06_02535 [Flavobacteriales bacterium]|nr:hypothetical protein [Flavobacteriales bacterium]
MKTASVNIRSIEQLREAVVALEARQETEGAVLREHFMLTYESIRPVNLIKSAFNEVTGSEELKEHLVSSSVGLVAGHLTRKAYNAVNGNEGGSIAGTAIQFGVTNLVAQHPDMVMAAGRGLFRMIYRAWNERERTPDHRQDEVKGFRP